MFQVQLSYVVIIIIIIIIIIIMAPIAYGLLPNDVWSTKWRRVGNFTIRLLKPRSFCRSNTLVKEAARAPCVMSVWQSRNEYQLSVCNPVTSLMISTCDYYLMDTYVFYYCTIISAVNVYDSNATLSLHSNTFGNCPNTAVNNNLTQILKTNI